MLEFRLQPAQLEVVLKIASFRALSWHASDAIAISIRQERTLKPVLQRAV
jgi:hypothetical protein